MSPDPEDVERFRALLSWRLGLLFGDEKLDFLRDVLRQGALEGGHARPVDYIRALEAGGPGDWDGLAGAVTVGETYFFRHWDSFRALLETALPVRVRARGAQRRLSLLSAGCSTGEEPYSLAMALRERFPELEGWSVDITGADLNPAALARAREGLYPAWSLRDTPEDLRGKYFLPEGKGFRVRPKIRSMVAFERRNLAEPAEELWGPGRYDVVFCRNMLMYFQPKAAAELVARAARALVPGGFLFLGTAETLRGLSQDFHLCHTHGTFYYQRLEHGVRGPTPPPKPLGAQAESPDHEAGTAVPWDPSLSWIESIQRATDRIAGLEARASGGKAREAAPERAGLDRCLDLLRQERFGDALKALPPERGDTDALLLRAVLLTDLGLLREAEAACERLLAADEMNSGAHYVLALCREQAGDLEGASERDRTAAYLDPSFAMPWLHLGLLARRRRDQGSAARHLDHARALLLREDSLRLLLFGGGFGREGLAQLCGGAAVQGAPA